MAICQYIQNTITYAKKVNQPFNLTNTIQIDKIKVGKYH